MKHRNRNRWLHAGLVLCATLVLTFLAKHYEFPDIQINHVEEITIPGVEGEYEFLFLTDLHLAVKTREDLGPLGDADTRIAGFTNLQGTISAKQLPQWISYANQEQVDAVLMGGGEEMCHFIALICDIGLHNQRQLCASHLWHKDLPKYVANLFWNYYLDKSFEVYKNTGAFSVPSMFRVHRNIA